jgi:hypothetical protein
MQSKAIRLNLENGSVSFMFSLANARELQETLTAMMNQLMTTAFKDRKPGEKLIPQQPIEYESKGDIVLEVFCNPNLWPSPFAAKVVLTVRDDRIRLSTEVGLTRLIEDVNDYIETISAVS